MQTPNYPIEERNYYSVDDRVRKAWVVVINYEDNYNGDLQCKSKIKLIRRETFLFLCRIFKMIWKNLRIQRLYLEIINDFQM